MPDSVPGDRFGAARAAIAPAASPGLSSRRAAMAGFVEACGWGGVTPSPLAADASFRAYWRLRQGNRRAVVMDAPPPQEDVGAYVSVATILRRLGLSAPEIFAEDREQGFLLIEDFGDASYNRVLAAGADEPALYALAVDTLVALQHAAAANGPAPLPPYDSARLLDEAVLLVDWYLPALSGAALDPALREEYLALWRDLLPPATAPFPPTLVLRDFHIDNLMLLGDRDGVRRCGLLDFQDAVCGPPAYDLVSLVEDARRDVGPALRAAMTERWLAAFPALDRRACAVSAAILAAQRNCKIIGIFTRLWRRDGKPGYLVHIPRVWRLLEQDLGEPALAPIKRWLDRHLPQEMRRAPDPRGPA